MCPLVVILILKYIPCLHESDDSGCFLGLVYAGHQKQALELLMILRLNSINDGINCRT